MYTSLMIYGRTVTFSRSKGKQWQRRLSPFFFFLYSTKVFSCRNKPGYATSGVLLLRVSRCAHAVREVVGAAENTSNLSDFVTRSFNFLQCSGFLSKKARIRSVRRPIIACFSV